MGSIYDGFKNRATVLTFINPVSGAEEDFLIDASLSVSTNLNANVTKFPVEGRETVTDHVQPQPLKLSLKGVISESPSQKLLTLATSIASGVVERSTNFSGLTSTFATAALASAAAAAAGFTASKPNLDAGFGKLLTIRSESDPGYPKRAMLGLARAFDRGTLFKVRTYFSDRLYNDMVITQLSFEQDADIGDSLSFSMELQKITTVKAFSRGAAENRMADPAGSSATDSVDEGKNTVTEEKPDSIAKQAIENFIEPWVTTP